MAQGRLTMAGGGSLDGRSLRKASKALEKAVVNFYRHLMLLDNYALLNYTAFQKVRAPERKARPPPSRPMHRWQRLIPRHRSSRSSSW